MPAGHYKRKKRDSIKPLCQAQRHLQQTTKGLGNHINTDEKPDNYATFDMYPMRT